MSLRGQSKKLTATNRSNRLYYNFHVQAMSKMYKVQPAPLTLDPFLSLSAATFGTVAVHPFDGEILKSFFIILTKFTERLLRKIIIRLPDWRFFISIWIANDHKLRLGTKPLCLGQGDVVYLQSLQVQPWQVQSLPHFPHLHPQLSVKRRELEDLLLQNGERFYLSSWLFSLSSCTINCEAARLS